MNSIYQFFSDFDSQEVFSSFLIFFAVMDILGSTAIIVNFRRKVGHIEAKKATIAVGIIMSTFLFVGESLLRLFHVDISSFSVAGGIVLFILGLEMVLNIDIFKIDTEDVGSSSIVPLAFPMLAGAGTLTTILALKAEYKDINILGGTLINLIFVYIILEYSEWFERKLGRAGLNVIRKVMGIVLLSIAVKLVKTHLFL
ncbi:MAG: MarC family protein [Cytophagales bacterium]|nr:MarC family protein [Cytophagales bacterium]